MPAKIADPTARKVSQELSIIAETTMPAVVSIQVDQNLLKQAEGELILLGLADDHIHAPNEHFGLDRFEKDFLVIGHALFELA